MWWSHRWLQAAPEQATFLFPALEDESWPDTVLLDLDRALPESADMSSVADISSHVCESFFLSPESMLDCEQPVRRIYQSLRVAVDSLLEMTLDSTRQVRTKAQVRAWTEWTETEMTWSLMSALLQALCQAPHAEFLLLPAIVFCVEAFQGLDS